MEGRSSHTTARNWEATATAAPKSPKSCKLVRFPVSFVLGHPEHYSMSKCTAGRAARLKGVRSLFKSCQRSFLFPSVQHDVALMDRSQAPGRAGRSVRPGLWAEHGQTMLQPLGGHAADSANAPTEWALLCPVTKKAPAQPECHGNTTELQNSKLSHVLGIPSSQDGYWEGDTTVPPRQRIPREAPPPSSREGTELPRADPP